MTATSPISSRRRFGLPSMESLGFFESAYVSSSPPIVDGPVAAASNQTTSVRTIVGKHTKQGVEGLWDTTVIDAPTLVDWRPGDLEPVLGRRNIRWSAWLTAFIAVIAVSGFGYWVSTRTASEAESARQVVASDIALLSQDLETAGNLAARLSAGDIGSDYSAVIGSLNDTARNLFASAATLNSDDSALRISTSELSADALRISKELNSAVGFRLTLEPVLAVPEFETDPSLTDIATATLEFGEWRAHLDEMAEMLPVDFDDQLMASFETFRSSLRSAQGTYIDSLQASDRYGALRVLTGLESDLDQIRELLTRTLSERGEALRDRISTTRSDLTRLVR